MNESEFQELMEMAWQRRLTEREEAELLVFLDRNPELRARYEEELGLIQLLGRLPDMPVSSNFTSQVLQGIGPAGSGRANSSGWPGWWGKVHSFGWARAVGFVSVLAVVSAISVQAYRSHARREMARSVAAFSDAASLAFFVERPRFDAPTPATQPAIGAGPTLEVFQDFEAIRSLSYLPDPGDVTLMSYLQN